jgi:hypothetical protein
MSSGMHNNIFNNPHKFGKDYTRARNALENASVARRAVVKALGMIQ